MTIDRCVDGAGGDTLKRLDHDGGETVDLAAELAETCSLGARL